MNNSVFGRLTGSLMAIGLVICAASAVACSDEPIDGNDGQAVVASQPGSAGPAGAAAPRPHHTRFIVACDSRTTMKECTEILSDRGNVEQIKRVEKKNGLPQFSDYREERCPTEQAVGRCVHKTRIGYEQLNPDSQASLATVYYAPITEENARARCADGMFQAPPL